MAAIAHAKDELASFLAAWNASGLDSYIQKQLSTYPAHGILRRMAGVYAANGNFPKMVETVRTFRSVVHANPTPLFRLIEAAGVMQAAGLAGRIDRQQMQRLIQGGKNDDPVETVLQKIIRDTTQNQRQIGEIAEHFLEVINGDFTSASLTQTAQVIGY
jgi:hypothetical protein